MSEATELLEHMEHAAHGGHEGGGHGGHGGPGKGIGITMAILGVMLAFCAAMVGSARTDLIKATVEQSNKWSIYQGESTKFRIMESDVEMLRALTPSKAELKHFEERLATVKRLGGKSDDEDTTELKEAIHVATTELADVLTPDQEDEDRLEAIGATYKRDMAEAREDAEAYDGVIEAHHESAEWFERAQLCAEIGIVIASIALLMASRGVWAVSLLIGLVRSGHHRLHLPPHALGAGGGGGQGRGSGEEQRCARRRRRGRRRRRPFCGEVDSGKPRAANRRPCSEPVHEPAHEH